MKNFDITLPKNKQVFQDVGLEPLYVYLNLAESTIRKYGGKYRKFLINSEDAIAYIAMCIMMADLKFVEGKGSSKKTWRISQALFGISKYLVKIGKTSKGGYSSFDKTEYVYNKTPDFEMMEEEQNDKTIEILFKSGLQEREAQIVKMRIWDNMTLLEIGKEYNISKQMAGMIYNRAIKKLEKLWNKT